MKSLSIRFASIITLALMLSISPSWIFAGPSAEKKSDVVSENDSQLLSSRDYRQRIATLLETFDGIVTTGDVTDELSDVYGKIRPLLSDSRVEVRVDTQPLKSTLLRARFTLDSASGKAVILLNHTVLDIADQNPVPAMTAYAGMLAHLDDFRDKGAAIADLYSDPLEYYLAQMDNIYLQGLFAKDYALPLYGKEKFDEYEYYILNSMEVDGFSSHSLFVWSIDKDIIYSMLGLSTQLARGGVTPEDYVDSVLSLGQEIRDNFDKSKALFDESSTAGEDDQQVARRTLYIAATSGNTYRTLGSVIFGTMVNSVMDDEQYAAVEDKINQINHLYTIFQDLLKEVDDFRTRYRNDYMSGFLVPDEKE